jgi:hypothetical protein
MFSGSFGSKPPPAALSATGVLELAAGAISALSLTATCGSSRPDITITATPIRITSSDAAAVAIKTVR